MKRLVLLLLAMALLSGCCAVRSPGPLLVDKTELCSSGWMVLHWDGRRYCLPEDEVGNIR